MTRIAPIAAAALLALTAPAFAGGSDLDAAVKKGGEMLKSDQIAELIVGKVVTAKAGENTFRFFYDPANVLSGEMINGGWKGKGAFAITDTNQVCVSMAQDQGRYRCLTVVRDGDTVRKYNAAGKMTFELLGFEEAAGL